MHIQGAVINGMNQTIGMTTSAENCWLWKLPTQTQQGELLSIKLQASDIFSFANVYLFRSEHDRNKIFLSLENGASVTPGEYPETSVNNF